MSDRCPLYLQKRTLVEFAGTSAKWYFGFASALGISRPAGVRLTQEGLLCSRQFGAVVATQWPSYWVRNRTKPAMGSSSSSRSLTTIELGSGIILLPAPIVFERIDVE